MSRLGRLMVALVIFVVAFLTFELLYRLLAGTASTLWISIGLNVAAVFTVFFLAAVFNERRAQSLHSRRKPHG